MFSLKGKRALITGASAGIGQATAYRLLQQGCDVLLVARRKGRLEDLRTRWSEEFPGQKILTWDVDIRNFSEIEDRIEKDLTWLQGLSVLVNNAGLARGADPFQNAEWRDWEDMIETNIKALLFITRKLIPFLQASAPSHIVNLGSIAGRWTYSGGSVYCATKFAVRSISEGLRIDLLGKKIRVTNIEPGMVETEFSEVRFRDKEKAKEVYRGLTPLKAEDIAECIVWSLSQPEHVNIQELVVYPTEQASPNHTYRA